MLNNTFLSKLFNHDFPSILIKDIHWKSQDSNKDSILFYRLSSDIESQEVFKDRIDKAQFAWLILNIDHPSRPMNSYVISENQWPQIQKALLDELYPLPNLKLIGITGTNGKTTTTELVLQLGELCGKRGMSIGTLGVREKDHTILDFGLTSPSFIDLRKFLNLYGASKDFCVLEVSSHALTQNRLYEIYFDMAGWLSFSQDHLDYHKTMEDYFSAKLLILDHLKPNGKVFVPKKEKDLFQRIHRVTNCVEQAPVIEQTLPLFFSTEFNRNNLEVAVSLVEHTFNLKAPDTFGKINPPEGRFYIKQFKKSYVVVDFAHTPDALENICRGIKDSFPLYKLKILFGCGGDRDKLKRPLMGRVAQQFAEKIYLTSDNPRSELPEAIIDDIQNGFDNSQTTLISRIVDRKMAVNTALKELMDGEILLLAGKGHENFILSAGVKIPYSDIDEVEMFLARINS